MRSVDHKFTFLSNLKTIIGLFLSECWRLTQCSNCRACWALMGGSCLVGAFNGPDWVQNSALWERKPNEMYIIKMPFNLLGLALVKDMPPIQLLFVIPTRTWLDSTLPGPVINSYNFLLFPVKYSWIVKTWNRISLNYTIFKAFSQL